MQLLRQSLALCPTRVQAGAREEGREGVHHPRKSWEPDPHFRVALNAVVTLGRSDDFSRPLSDTLPLCEQNQSVSGNSPKGYDVSPPLNVTILQQVEAEPEGTLVTRFPVITP